MRTPREDRTDLPPPWICKICRRPLQQHVVVRNGQPTVVSYTHAIIIPGTPEHDPEPVPNLSFADQVSVCDFCSTPSPVWEFEVADFQFVIGYIEGRPEIYHSVENWYACAECKDDLLARQLDDIATRWFTHHPESERWSRRDKRAQRKFQINTVLTGFFANVRGQPFPIGSK